MITPPVPSCLNSTSSSMSIRCAHQADVPTAILHPADARARRITDGQWVRVFNDRGTYQARAIVADSVKQGVVVSQGVWWNRYTPDGVNCNTTTSTALTDFGAGAKFFDNLVEVEAHLPTGNSVKTALAE